MDHVETRCIALIAESKHIAPSGVSLTSSFEELGMDSLDKINLSFAVEEEFDIAIPDDSLNELRTVGDVVRGVERLRAAKQLAERTAKPATS